MNYIPLKRKSTALGPSPFQAKRPKNDPEDLLSFALSQQLHITDAESRTRAFSSPDISEYNSINDTLREAVFGARHIRNSLAVSQGTFPDRYTNSSEETKEEYNVEKDKEDIENYYNPINSWLKNVQFSNGPNYHF